MFAASKTASVSGGYQISRSLRFNSADSAYLNRTPASAGNQKTWTLSFWVKRANLGGSVEQMMYAASNGSGTDSLYFNYAADDSISIYLWNATAGFLTFVGRTTAVFRDPSAWYHMVLAVDTTQATGTDRVKFYVNNVLQAISTYTAPAQNSDCSTNSTGTHYLGRHSSAAYYLNGYMTEINFVNAQQLTPSSFGETNAQTGVWQPKAYSGSYGTNGFYLNFSDNSNTTAATLGKDYSGNGNNWTPNNFSVTAGAGNDSLVDSPTSYGTDTGVGGTVRGNYCTFNAVDKGTSITLSNGNLDFVQSGAGSDCARATFSIPSSGKWYWENFVSAVGSGCNIGIATNTTSLTAGGAITGVLYQYSGYKSINSWSNDGSYGSAYTTNDLIGIAVDMDAGTITFYKNGSSLGAAYSSLSSATQYLPFFQGTGTTWIANFGQRPFAYTAPSGFKALCTQNLPTPTIGATTATQAGKFFAPVLYSGNGASSRAVTGVGFQPDFVWLKARNYAFVNGLFDAVRGGNKLLISNLSSAEITNEVNGYLSTFDSDGFTLTAGSTNNDTFNGSANSMVSWNWKANGSGSTNTAGSITSTVSANTTSGFSIVTYTGTGANATVGHGLGVAPSFIIVKRRDDGSSWNCYQISLGASQYIQIDGTAGSATNTGVWNNTAPTTTVFSIGTAFAGVNASGSTHVAYCFAPIAGYSAFGQYTGNGSADGPFVYTGFRTAYFMVKRTDTSGFNWIVYDTTRDTYNVAGKELIPNASTAEATYPILDFLSNGFKIRINATSVNDSGGTYIYMCFASNPFKYSLAR